MSNHYLSLNRGQTGNSAIDWYAGSVPSAAGYAADKATLDAAMATLVADGATPTQAHVTAAAAALTAFEADLSAGDDVELRVKDAANLTRLDLYNILKAMMRFFQQASSTNWPNL